jgi:hypothetical protein
MSQRSHAASEEYRKRKRAKWGGGEFNALPREFSRSAVLKSLSPHESKLFLDLQAQYGGWNNGDLCVTWKVMHVRGWKSRTTLQLAKKGLLAKGVILETRRGGRNRCALYALSIYQIDECNGKHDARSTEYPTKDWLKHEPNRPIAELQAEHKQKEALRKAV